MKCKKFISITLVSILLLTSASIAIGGTSENKQIIGTSSVKGKISDLFNGIFNQISIFSKILDKIFKKPTQDVPHPPPQPPQPPQQPKLGLELLVKEQFPVGEPIPVTATLTNLGTVAVNLCDIALEFGTLDFQIKTPDGQTIHYIGKIKYPPTVVYLKPEEKIVKEIPDITQKELFGTDLSSEVQQLYFEQIGVYYITGIYKSFLPIPTFTSAPFWIGTLYSQTYKFEIIKAE